MNALLTCLRVLNDPLLLGVASLVCLTGVYGSFSIAAQAGRSEGSARARWGIVSLVAAGCTAWATHMIALLAFRPGIPSGFEPVTTALSLALAVLGIGLGLTLTIGRRGRRRRFAGGVVIGVGVGVLHYVGQVAYVVRGIIHWDLLLAGSTLLASLPLFGLATIAAVERRRIVRLTGAPLLVLGIGVLHLGGMAAMRIEFDPTVRLPAWTVEPEHLAPIVAAMSAGLFLVAMLGLRLTVNARAKLRLERARLGELANLGLEGLAICEDERILTANDSLSRLSGFSRKDLSGMALGELLPRLDRAALPEREEVDAELAGMSGGMVPVRVLRHDVRLAGRWQTVVAFRDQSERLRSEARIRALAFSDTLTGLANRTRLHDELARLVEGNRTGDAPFSLLTLDLDGFKGVNDAFGHAGGDEVLRVVAARMLEATGGRHLVARLGGDEFAILVAGSADPLQVTAMARDVVKAIDAPIPVEHQVAHLSASVGVITTAAGRSPTAEELVTGADLALYDAKANGRSRVRLFTPELRSASNERRGLADDLRDAWDGRHFELYYQPQVALADGRTVGAEALIRWNYPYVGLLAPAAFLSVLEAGHLALPVGDWVLRTACREAASLRAAGLSDFRVGVNLFAAQIRAPDFVERVEEALRASALPAGALELEITENIVLRNERTIARHLSRLRAMGVGVAFDDFGTGFASLTMLKQLEITRLKIDRSFVRDIATDGKDQGIVDAIVRMAEGCGLEVIAEGIETERQADHLRGRVAEGQGYLFGRPMRSPLFRRQVLGEASEPAARAAGG